MARGGSQIRRGNSSNTHGQLNNDNEVVTSARNNNDSTRIRLDHELEHGVWFSEKAVVSLISDTIQSNYKEHAPNWFEASKTIKKHWWEYFLLKVTFEPSFEAQVKAAWEAAMKTRLRQMVYRAGRSKDVPGWMDESLHKKVLDRTLEDSFKDKSSKNSANRKSGGDEKGKAPATHAMGRMNAVQLMVKMAGPDLNLPPQHRC